MDEQRIKELLETIDGRSSDAEFRAVRELRKLLGPRLATLLLERYRTARSAKVRTSCVFHSMGFARESDDAVELGVEAINDKSKHARNRGAQLLAYSLRKDVLPRIRAALDRLGDGPGREDLLAAIDAIEHQNHNYFLDREHTGMITFRVG